MRKERAARVRALSLEPTHNAVEQDPGEPRIMIRVCGCGRQVCGRCGTRLGYYARHRLMARLTALQAEHGVEGDVQMWTLTVDPKRYESPEAAWDDVREKRRIGELMRSMKQRYWVAVLEWHESGWPHWHLLVWAPVTRLYLDHAQVTARWGIGIVRYSGRNGKPMRYAVNYVTKYITKRNPPPEWVMDRSHVKLIWSSRAWGPIRTGGVVTESEEPAQPVPHGAHVPNRIALANCGQLVRVSRLWMDRYGTVHEDHIGRAMMPWRWMQAVGRRVGAEVLHYAVTVQERAPEWGRLRRHLPLLE